jgi:peroxiredoxin
MSLAWAGGGHAEDPLIGSRPPEWQLRDWINSKPLALKDLKGKLVLVRWWTGGGCAYCSATAPALNEFHSTYQGKGLVVIGVYHHKAATPLKKDDVKREVSKKGFQFPVAIDPDRWPTLRRWWLDNHKRSWTSVSFLIDREGVIRHIHPGGQYVKGDKAYQAMKTKIEALLREK